MSERDQLMIAELRHEIELLRAALFRHGRGPGLCRCEECSAVPGPTAQEEFAKELADVKLVDE